MQLAAGTILGGRYRIIEPLADSHLATVHLAWDQTSNQTVVIKAISREADEKGEFSRRFRREAKILNELHSPLIVRILEFDVHADRHLFDLRVNHDDISSRMPDRSSSPSCADEVASCSARARGRDDHRLTAPIEGQRHEVRLAAAARGCNPDVDL